MATDEARLREHLLESITQNVPRGFLDDFQRRTVNAYREKFHDVMHDPTALSEQRLAKLIQDRMFRMDWELAQAAKACGMPVTSKPLPENAWSYTYVVAGSFGLTQSYVPAIGALPKPAKFRDDLATAAGVPRLPLDDPKEIYQIKDFYALFAHNPLGKFFTEDEQQLGTLQFCIPCKDMNDWTFAMSFAELLSYYPAMAKKPRATRAPTWKQRVVRGGETS
jgi:hypothetical protein